jgi:TatD DNase family protein
MWIDTHCHLDAGEFDADRDAVVERAAQAGVGQVVVPAVDVASFARVRECAQRFGFAYALGIHPLAVGRAQPSDIEHLRAAVEAAMPDPRFVAVGEIGLDFLVDAAPVEAQEWFYLEQLKVAARLGLPVILHVRKSADRLLFHLRRTRVPSGIAHAFNGSPVQAEGFLEMGFCLGFGGSSTYDGSLRIRRFAAGLPETAIVLETDAPDIPPQWMRDGRSVLRNEPQELPRIAAGIAQLRGVTPQHLACATSANALRVLPRLAAL